MVRFQIDRLTGRHLLELLLVVLDIVVVFFFIMHDVLIAQFVFCDFILGCGGHLYLNKSCFCK